MKQLLIHTAVAASSLCLLSAQDVVNTITDFDDSRVRAEITGISGEKIYTQSEIDGGGVKADDMRDATKYSGDLRARSLSGDPVNMIWRQDTTGSVWACFGTTNTTPGATSSAFMLTKYIAPCAEGGTMSLQDFGFWARSDIAGMLVSVELFNGSGSSLWTSSSDWTPPQWGEAGDDTWRASDEGGGFSGANSTDGFYYEITATNPNGTTARIDVKNVFSSHICTVPEPSSIMLLGLGALGLLTRRKRH